MGMYGGCELCEQFFKNIGQPEHAEHALAHRRQAVKDLKESFEIFKSGDLAEIDNLHEKAKVLNGILGHSSITAQDTLAGVRCLKWPARIPDWEFPGIKIRLENRIKAISRNIERWARDRGLS